MPRTIYFDYNATTPLDPAVRDAMLPFLGEIWGNPSSVHHVGRQARALLDEARERAAKVLEAKPSEIVFTSGGTESNNLAIFGTARRLKPKGRHLITSAIEHHAVLHCFDSLEKKEGFEVTRLPVNSEGRVSVDDLRKAIRPDTIFVSVMAANNEIGTIQPVAELGAICRERGIVFHTDAAQWLGKLVFETIGQFNADLVSVCAHKFHGPKGAGLLYIKSPFHPDPIAFGGGHENERRAGTENLAGVIGLVEAMERFLSPAVFRHDLLLPLTRRMIDRLLKIEGVEFVGSPEERLAKYRCLCCKGGRQHYPAWRTGPRGNLRLQWFRLFCRLAGTVPCYCRPGKRDCANSLVRFSPGRDSTLEEVDLVCRVFSEVVLRAQLSQ